MIELRNVGKTFRNNSVLEDVNLKLCEGKIYGIVGRNGSGKSVLLKMICGFLNPTEGEILIDGDRLEPGHYTPETGVVFDEVGFLPFYSAKENLYMLAQIRKRIGEREIDAILEQVGLSSGSKIYRNFSLGMKKKLAIAQAFMEKPKILLLDEPMNALDEASVEKMRGFFREYVQTHQAIMLVTSHHKDDIEALADEVYEVKNMMVRRTGE